jgi:hypothetical protein
MRLVLALAVFALAACSPPSTGFRPGVEMTFMRACEAQPNVPDGVCACTWERVEAEVDPNDFDALEQLPGPQRDAHPIMRQIQGYSTACALQRVGEPAGGQQR